MAVQNLYLFMMSLLWPLCIYNHFWIENVVTTPTTTQPQHSSWVGHENDFAPPIPPPTQTQHQPLWAPVTTKTHEKLKVWQILTIVCLRFKYMTVKIRAYDIFLDFFQSKGLRTLYLHMVMPQALAYYCSLTSRFKTVKVLGLDYRSLIRFQKCLKNRTQNRRESNKVCIISSTP